MTKTKDFHETIRDRAQRDRKFRQALLQEAIEQCLAGDIDAGKSMMRNYLTRRRPPPADRRYLAPPAR